MWLVGAFLGFMYGGCAGIIPGAVAGFGLDIVIELFGGVQTPTEEE